MDNDSVIHVPNEKHKADQQRYENQTRHIRSRPEYLPTVDKDGVVKAGEGLGLFDLRFDFFWGFAVSGRDYKDLSAGQAVGAFSGVFVGKGNQIITIWAVEPDCHILVLRISYIVLRINSKFETNSKFKYGYIRF